MSETKDWTRDEEMEFKSKWPSLHRALANNPEMRLNYLSKCVRPSDIEPLSNEARERLHEEVLANQRESVRADLLGFERAPGEIEKTIKSCCPPTGRELFKKIQKQKRGED